jgi:predicted ATP-binding protein involved in virulence
MKLKRISLRNFRCFERLEIEFDDRLTVFVGDNGAGKTALLDAIAIGFGRYLTKLPGVAGRITKETDLRIDLGEKRTPILMLGLDAEDVHGSPIEWSAGRRRDAAVTSKIAKEVLSESELQIALRGFKALDEYTVGLINAETERKPYFLPVIAYYGTNRAIREEVQRRRGFKKSFLRFEALDGALEPDSRFRAAFEWFNALEDVERREQVKRLDFEFRHPELETVRSAIVRMLGSEFENPRTETRPLRFVIDRKNPNGSVQTLRVTQLSDGYRVILGLVMDFARRLAQANSQLTSDGLQIVNPLDLPAIALIDEVDLHLHPSWQQRVLVDLMNIFSKTQFIVTTHSAQVLSTVRRENIRVIGRDNSGDLIATPPLAMTYGEPSGDVLQSVMLVDPIPPVAEKAELQKLTELVDQGRYEESEAINLIETLSVTLGAQHPQLLRLSRSIQRQEMLKK